MNRRLIFFGNERLATGVTTQLPVLHALQTAGYNICAIVSSTNVGSSRKHRELEISTFASTHNIPLLTHISADDITALKADIGILVAYGRLVPTGIIQAFPHGIINLHPSLLPHHRGPIPLEAVIRDGDNITGISLMQLAPAMDAGPVFYQVTVPLADTITKQALADHLGLLGAEQLIKTLPSIIDGTLVAQPQDDIQASYDQRLTKPMSQINWQQPARHIERQIRAYAGWPGSITTITGTDVTITGAHIWLDPNPLLQPAGTFEKIGKQLICHTTDGILIIDSLKPAGSKDMPASAFLAGHSL